MRLLTGQLIETASAIDAEMTTQEEGKTVRETKIAKGRANANEIEIENESEVE